MSAQLNFVINPSRAVDDTLENLSKPGGEYKWAIVYASTDGPLNNLDLLTSGLGEFSYRSYYLGQSWDG